MHEMGIVSGVLDAVHASAEQAGADKVLGIVLEIGQMTEVVEDALVFAFEALSEGTMSEGAQLDVRVVEPSSLCLACGHEFAHDRFHRSCPECGSYETSLITGRELKIVSIEVNIPDEDE